MKINLVKMIKIKLTTLKKEQVMKIKALLINIVNKVTTTRVITKKNINKHWEDLMKIRIIK